MSARLIIGDVREAVASLPDGCVDLVMTSPPFLALRSYLPADHPDKALEIGSERTPADFLDTLLDVVEECRRVLAPHGSLVFELGDTYAGSGGAGGDYSDDGLRSGQPAFTGSAARTRPDGNGKVFRGGTRQVDKRNRGGMNGRASMVEDAVGGHHLGGLGWPLDKSLTGIPTLFAWSLAYGRNLLRPEHTTEPWRIRNLVAWARPNPPVGALADKFRPATSYLTVATMARDRWFDMDAVRVPAREDKIPPPEGWSDSGARPSSLETGRERSPARRDTHDGTAPLLDYWEIPTQPYKGSHYATFPEELPKRVILSMCPERVCRECGEPSRRVVGKSPEYRQQLDQKLGRKLAPVGERVKSVTGSHAITPEVVTLGWSDCRHDAWRPGVVLDPFAGSGTTLQVATRLARDAIGIDLDERNLTLVQSRVGMFLTDVEHLNAEAAS